MFIRLQGQDSRCDGRSMCLYLVSGYQWEMILRKTKFKCVPFNNGSFRLGTDRFNVCSDDSSANVK